MYQLKVNQQQTIVALRRQGWSKRRIARELDLDRATVRKYLARAEPKSPTPQTGSAESPPPKSPIDPQTGLSTGCGPVSSCEPLAGTDRASAGAGLVHPEDPPGPGGR